MTARIDFDDAYIPEPNSGCWLWERGCNAFGYGVMHRSRRGYTFAHRFSYERFVGPISPRMFVLHKCDVRCCVNPGHLFLGTQADNNADMVLKGRLVAPQGERHGNAKLTAEIVREIRSSPMSAVALSKRFGVSSPTVDAVRRGETWRHVPSDPHDRETAWLHRLAILDLLANLED